MEPRRFFLDTQTRQFVSSATFPVPSGEPTLFNEDVEQIQLYFLDNGNFVDYSANTVKFAVGITAPLALATSWSSISTGITATVATSITGGTGTAAVQTLSFSAEPEVGSFALRLPARNVTVSSVSASVFLSGNHGLLNGQSVTLTGFSTPSGFTNGTQYVVLNRTRDGFQIADTSAATTAKTVSVASGGGTAELDAITTPLIAAGAGASQVEDAFVAAGISVDAAPQIIVTGDPANGFTFTFSNTQSGINFSALEIVGNTLARAKGLVGTLNLNTEELQAAIIEGTSQATIEIEVSGGGVRHTYQTAALLGADIINSVTGSEPSPVVESTATSFDLQSPNGTVYTISATDEGSLQTIENTVAASAPTGFTLIAPNLTKYQITVNDDGVLVVTDIS